MKKTIMCLLIITLLVNSSAHALSWAIEFVVWNGKVYEVTDEKVIDSLIGKRIGEVKTKPNDMTGSHYGNASNYYPIGTGYFKISGISPRDAIAVEESAGKWVKAVYAHKAPFHWMNVFNGIFPFLVLFAIVLLFVLWKRKVRRHEGDNGEL
ncbi:hypothetical protein QTL97_00190 [Sporosarcina thermotolerans]|uniref:DUF3592 domain-containing protein n=1 Tax=Sporosarcina thermotolerans TaxID=633404 RepID=A0AAW9A4S8_9BACL|nr:hypothetical protein [Sporosarcina thermotolerans]MDW0115358.1 hypothetical protein [Sporosarcina thermotolerans]WHT47299.1 hypothetical protein QNH10_13925 [Sporosarcina thermotolerans]